MYNVLLKLLWRSKIISYIILEMEQISNTNQADLLVWDVQACNNWICDTTSSLDDV